LFNYRTLARELGCKSTSELVRVIKYGKAPSRMMVERFIDLMKLDKEESMYLILLSHYSVVQNGKKNGNEIIDTYKRMLLTVNG
jgi:hypothetical protein